jgi:2-amino-4-hydroxy-6-hydroxymethyldihydropteridine diphosphokinase
VAGLRVATAGSPQRIAKAAFVGIALGSNLGDRQAFLDHAVARLRSVLADLRVSRVFETDPVAIVGPQHTFLNAAVTGLFSGTPRALLTILLQIEREHGRERPHPGASRTLDLDLIFSGSDVVEDPGLTVPHPRFRERRFVLEPLAEIAGGWRDPVTGLTVQELLARLPKPETPGRRS